MNLLKKCPNEECIAYGACGKHGPRKTCLLSPPTYYGVAETTPWGRIEVWSFAPEFRDPALREPLHAAIAQHLQAVALSVPSGGPAEVEMALLKALREHAGSRIIYFQIGHGKERAAHRGLFI